MCVCDNNDEPKNARAFFRQGGSSKTPSYVVVGLLAPMVHVFLYLMKYGVSESWSLYTLDQDETRIRSNWDQKRT